MIFSKSTSVEAQEALAKAWDNWHKQRFGHHAKNTPSKPDNPKKRRRRSCVSRTLQMNGHGPIAEESGNLDEADSDFPLSQEGYQTCSQELMLSHPFPE